MMLGLGVRNCFTELALVAALLALYGCGEQKTGSLTRAGSGSFADSRGIPQRLMDPVDNPSGVTTSGWVKAAVQPLGFVSYDHMTLPLVSPDGRWIATQTGIAPKWETALAEPGSELPMLTRVEVYALDRRDNLTADQLKPPALLTQVGETALLGRSCDAEGFLIESPREDGARWIGKVAWEDGSVRWLVQGTDVNAFASLGPQGELAWSRRALAAEHFDLVVRTASGEWTIPSQGDDWLMPTWSGRSDGLFALNLSGKKLQLRFAPAGSAAMFRSAMLALPIVSDAKTFHAYQSLIGQGGAIRTSQIDQLVYFHPGVKRMALWRPMAAAGQQALVLGEGSLAAMVGEDDFALVTMNREMVRQNIRDSRFSVRIISGMHIARATPESKWPCVLLSPDQDRIRLLAIQLLPNEDAPAAVASK